MSAVRRLGGAPLVGGREANLVPVPPWDTCQKGVRRLIR